MIVRVIGLAFGLALSLAPPAHSPAMAQEARKLDVFQDWTAYKYDSDAGSVCYVSSRPTDSEPKNVNRDDLYVTVMHKPSDRVRNLVNITIGYAFQENSVARVTIGDETFELFTHGDGAWAASGDIDVKIVEAMKAGTTMRVEGTSWRPTKTTDLYSLKGVSAALEKIDKECP